MTEARELDLFEFVAFTASQIPKDVFTKPEDDWTPVMFMETNDGERPMLPIQPFMESDATKDILAHVVMPTVITGLQAVKVVLVLSIWAAEVASAEELEPIRYVPPSQRDNRQEKLLLVEYTADGISRHSWAQIIRHEDSPPTLGEWEDLETTGVDGRFVDPVVTALQNVRRGT